MQIVGLTGGIASGKSTVSTILATNHRIPIIDADRIARDILEPGTKPYRAVIAHFGPSIQLPSSPRIDRSALGTRIFSSPTDRAVLNSITHPAVRKEMFRQVVRHWFRGEKVVVLDVPLLIEAGLWKFVGEVVLVSVHQDVQLERLIKREPIPPNKPLTEEEAQARINSQLPLKEKAAYADYTIDNSTTLSALETSISELVRTLNAKADGFPSWRWAWLCPPLGVLLAGLRLARKRWARSSRVDAKL